MLIAIIMVPLIIIIKLFGGTDAFSESILLLNVMRVWINELPRATPMNTYFVFKQMALTSKLGQFKINQPKCHMV